MTARPFFFGLSLLLLLAFSSSKAHAKGLDEILERLKSNEYNLGIGGGLLFINSDLGELENFTTFGTYRYGLQLSAEKRLHDFFGLQFNTTLGKLSQQDHSIDRDVNFESRIIQAYIGAVGYFDNGVILSKEIEVAPYIGVGIGYLFFSPYADLVDADGNQYHYWTDGKIRNQPMTPANIQTAVEITRDFEYETKLSDSSDFSQHTLTIPLTLGTRFKFSQEPLIEARLATSFHFTGTDFIDNFELNGDNDRFWFTRLSLHYTINQQP